MSAALPLRLPILTQRELILLQALGQDDVLGAAQNHFLRLEELRHLRFTRANLDEWTRRSFEGLQALYALSAFLLVDPPPALLEQFGADLEEQRTLLASFLTPVGAAAHADYAVCAVAVFFHATLAYFAEHSINVAAELEKLRDYAGSELPGASMVLVMGLLTLLVDDARSARAPTERHAVFARTAFLQAARLVREVGAEGIHVDPLPFMRTPRSELAAAALDRLLADTDGPSATTAFVDELALKRE